MARIDPPESGGQAGNSKSQISNTKWFDKLTTLSQVEGQIIRRRRNRNSKS